MMNSLMDVNRRTYPYPNNQIQQKVNQQASLCGNQSRVEESNMSLTTAVQVARQVLSGVEVSTMEKSAAYNVLAEWHPTFGSLSTAIENKSYRMTALKYVMDMLESHD